MANIKNIWSNLFSQPRSGWILPIIVALYITIFFNTHIYGLVSTYHPVKNIIDVLFMISAYFLVFFMVHFFTAILSVGKWRKGWLVFLLLISAGVSFMRNQYNVIFDETMIQNVVETDVHEASELMSFAWIFHIILFGVLPAFILGKIPVKPQSFVKDILHRIITIGAMIILLVLTIYPFYQSYASLLRSNHSLKDNIVPTAFLYSTFKYVKHFFPTSEPELKKIGTDAVLPEELKTARKTVMVIVVGETARVANFSLAGYPRDTNPLLQKRLNEKQDILFYTNFFSCGTSTAVSVPCMFSASTRKDFNGADEGFSENLLDVLTHAGLEVLWIDNNSGCKGVCARIHYTDMRGRTDDASCNQYGCSDMMLVKELETRIHSSANNLVVVLHQKGSHGPSYYERIPKAQEVFTPICRTSQLQECSHDEIVNSYDNTIVYTDLVLDNLISTLEKHSDDRDAALFYVSDHGESLGENNLYLHGMPYSIAPDEQTHVPALMWLSQSFLQRFKISYECLHSHRTDNFSHDNVFHTMLGLLDIKTSVYLGEYDMIKPCKKS